MTAQAKRLALVFGAFLAGLVFCFSLVLLVVGHSQSPAAFGVSAIGGPFTLTDENGRTVTDKDFTGKPFLVFFGYTHCPDICPTTLFEVSEVLRALGPDADRTAALFISVDSDRDKPAVLKDYLSSFDPHLHGLTGDPAQIQAVAKEYRVFFQKHPLDNGDYSMDHSALVYLMDKQGRFVAPFKLKRSAQEAAADLRRYL